MFEPMSGADAAWLRMDRENNLMVVNTIFHFAERPRWDAVEAAIGDRVVSRFTRFRQRARTPPVTIGLLAPWWETVDRFDLCNHLTRTDLSRREGSGVLDDHLATRIHVDLDRSRPLWHAEFIDLPGGAAALLLRTHHAIGDGAAIVKVLNAATVPIGQPRSPTHPSPGRKRVPEAAWPMRIEPDSWLKLGERLFRRGGSGTPLTAPLSGAKRTARLEPIDLAGLKSLATATSSTINDVFLAAIAGALRTYLGKLGVAARDLDISMPVSVRDPGEPPDALGNRFGTVFVRLPSSLADVSERRRRVTRRTQAIKSSNEARVVFGALSVLGHVPAAMSHAWVDAFIRDAVAVVTNVGGPRHPVALAGTPITSISALVPGTGPVGLGISFVSYAGQAVVSAIADRATMQDPASFVGLLQDELRPEPIPVPQEEREHTTLPAARVAAPMTSSHP